MRPRVVVGSALASVAILAIGWEVGAPAVESASGQHGQQDQAQQQDSPATKLTDGTYSGSTVETRFGPVQVEVTVAGGKFTDVKALQLTNREQRSVDISNQAAPILRSEVLRAQSASVATVSGATFTTQGYLSSLQSAIDKAGA